MLIKIPHAYRPPTTEDNLWKLNAAHLLTSQCKCGHVEADHTGVSRCGPCSKCKCKRFAWAQWLVLIAIDPSPKP